MIGQAWRTRRQPGRLLAHYRGCPGSLSLVATSRVTGRGRHGPNRAAGIRAETLPEIERRAREEDRVVIRVRPYATFATPPRHVYKAEDIDTLTHFTGSSQPW